MELIKILKDLFVKNSKHGTFIKSTTDEEHKVGLEHSTVHSSIGP